jgi:hypothetical protein
MENYNILNDNKKYKKELLGKWEQNNYNFSFYFKNYFVAV